MYQLLAGQNPPDDNNVWSYRVSSGGHFTGWFGVGNNSTYGQMHGAVRFPSIPLNRNQFVTDARLHLFAGATEGAGDGNALKVRLRGIDEDNTANFSSDPLGRSETDAEYIEQKTIPPGGGYGIGHFDMAAKNLVNEIIARGGWNYGNAMGFKIFDNGSTSGHHIWDSGEKAVLDLWLSAEPDLTPTPVSIAAPTFPVLTHYGIRVSAPGVDVKTATESQLFFTSRKKELRVKEERVILNQDAFAHGLAYAPCVLGFYTDSSNLVRIMNYPSNRFSVEPFIGVDSVNVNLFPVPNKPAYVYVFIDPLT